MYGGEILQLWVYPWRDTLKVVKSRLHRWCNDDMAAMWSNAIIDSKALHVRNDSSSTVNRNTYMAKLVVQNGQYRKVMNALTSDRLASPSPDILQEMLSKHFQAPPPSLSDDPVPPHLFLTHSDPDDHHRLIGLVPLTPASSRGSYSGDWP